LTAILTGSGPVEVIATGLVVRDHQGRATKDNRLQWDGAVFLAGQRLRMPERDARRESKRDRVQIVADIPEANFWAPDRLLRVEPGEMKAMADGPSSGALRIVAGCGFDPGGAAYRFHNALTEHTPHGTAFIRFLTRRNNPNNTPTQINATLKPGKAKARAHLLDADVVHCHIDPLLTQNAGLAKRPRPNQILVRHYHGTQFNGAGHQRPDADQVPVLSIPHDDTHGYVLVGARLQICALRPGRIQWLPIPMPVQRYSAMAAGRQRGPVFRVAHSPTRALIKGTKEFRKAIANLQKRGVPIEAVMIEKKPHVEALAMKATADASFDSFALGIQGSGLEAASMGQPVIAGDARVRDLHINEVGYCPYTFADNQEQLENQLERLATDPAFYAEEQRRVNAFVRQYHDYPMVAARYQKILEAVS
jgi:hypothetical protein